jgi:hypothetical protein
MGKSFARSGKSGGKVGIPVGFGGKHRIYKNSGAKTD